MRLGQMSSVLFLLPLLVGWPVFAQESSKSGEKKVVVCSTTQVADFTRQIVGDRWEVICVLGAGEDPHTYQPGNDDALAVGRADLCLENGWHLEGNEWMKQLATNANKPIVTCIEGVEEIPLDQNGKSIKDPHAWFNPKNAWIYTKNIRDAVTKLDPEHETEYASRGAVPNPASRARWLDQENG